MTEWLLLATSFLLMLVCGAFGAAEYSFVTVDRATVERAAESGDKRAQGTLAALRTLSTQLSGAQLGITITNLAIGFLAEPAIGTILHDPLKSLGLHGGALKAVAYGVALASSTIVTMLIGELVPKKLALALPLQVANRTQLLQRLFTEVDGLADPLPQLGRQRDPALGRRGAAGGAAFGTLTGRAALAGPAVRRRG